MQVQFSPDGRWFVSASFDKAIKLWDGLKGTFVATMRAHVGPVYQVAWSSDSRLFVSGSKDSTLKVRRRARRFSKRVTVKVRPEAELRKVGGRAGGLRHRCHPRN